MTSGAGNDSNTLLEELLGDVCRCGRRKKPNQTFCLRCYRALPAAMRRALYKLIGSGYAEAYADAAAYLDARG